MRHHKYVIVGAGMAADSAVRGIREIDKTGAIAVIGEEMHPPYNRPPLSKSLWKGAPLESIWRDSGSLGFALHLGKKIASIDPAKKVATDDAGNAYTYEKLLLATGGSPRPLPFPAEGVIYFRTLDDYKALRELAERGSEFVVIGGGFIGSEIAAALAMNGKRVTMIFPESGIGARPYPKSLSAFLNSYFRDRGITILESESVKSIQKSGGTSVVTTGSGKKILADGVVAGIGIRPETALAEAAGLKVGNGIVVDEMLRTSDHDIYAAGDVANFFNPGLEIRMRAEHEDNATLMGEMAGRNMAGQAESYTHLPFFYSDLFDLGYEAVGELDSGLEIVEDWKEPYRKGVIYYLKEERVRGVLLWNIWGQVPSATQLISAKGKHTRESLLGRIAD